MVLSAGRSAGALGASLALVLLGCAQGRGPSTGRSDGGGVPREDGGGGIECFAGETRCDGACVDTSRSPVHCGACGDACPAGDVCVAGACASSCPLGTTDCGGVCPDLTSDTAHCGVCGNACSAGELCLGGTCVTNCPAGQSDCDGVCRDVASDRSHCGGCGTACAPGEICASGACVLSCPAGQTPCSGSCRDLSSDEMHCGACGTVCPTGTLCSGGACASVCGSGLTFCAGSCVDTSSSPAHCGTCGRTCAASERCASGVCAPIPAETHPFPRATDTRVAAGGLYFWRFGDYVEGSRATSLSTTGRVDVHLVLAANGLTCDTQDVTVRINGIAVGSFSIVGGTTAVDRSFTFGPMAGPTYVVRYETTRQVASGCGAASYQDDSSTITFHAP